jgi:putative acetyltransferase
MSVCLLEGLQIRQAVTAADIEAADRLFRAYAHFLDVDLCFQGFSEELAGLPGAYVPPSGRLLLAEVAGEPVGCVALRPLAPEVCEMKRMWVEPGFGGRGIGRALAERVVAEARASGYHAMRLDTLPKLEAAQHVYRSLGFVEIPDYYDNPLEGVRMFELDLRVPPPD